MKSNIIVITIFVILLINSCDFTPRLHKKILIAQNYIEDQKYEKAILQYEKILKNSPPQKLAIKIYFQLGELYSIYFDNNEKALYYYSIIEKESDNPIWHAKVKEKMGEIYYSFNKNYQRSAECYNDLTAFVPHLKNREYYQYRLGKSYYKARELDQSLKIFKSIIDHRDHRYYIKSLWELGIISFQRKSWKKSISYFKQYLKVETRKDNIVQAKFIIANSYETMEELKKAYNIYYSILGEYPNTKVIRNRLNSIYTRKVARKR